MKARMAHNPLCCLRLMNFTRLMAAAKTGSLFLNHHLRFQNIGLIAPLTQQRTCLCRIAETLTGFSMIVVTQRRQAFWQHYGVSFGKRRSGWFVGPFRNRARRLTRRAII
jgi:hypothetical protein